MNVPGGDLDRVVNTYLRHVKLQNVGDALRNFWQAKLAQRTYRIGRNGSGSGFGVSIGNARVVASDSNRSSSVSSSSNTIPRSSLTTRKRTERFFSLDQSDFTSDFNTNQPKSDAKVRNITTGSKHRPVPATDINFNAPVSPPVSNNSLTGFNEMDWETSVYDLIVFETETVSVGAEQRYISYVTLPGGACFASPESKKTDGEAAEAAARAALYHSLVNEHPYRIVTQTYIDQSMAKVTQSKSTDSLPLSNLDTYRLALDRNLGRSWLELQEYLCALRLLDWSGITERLLCTGFTKDRLVSEYAHCVLDEAFRFSLCLAWISRLQRDSDASVKLYSEYLKCEAGLHDMRHQFAELRFEKEKRDVLRMAYSHFNHDELTGQKMLYASNFAIV